ncbi:MAG: hypothetical protein HC903_28975 [Methylacidiphilales bacterium]|nr:hypothetical protein [Candidatus Methylacidiphilales bacterium]NJR18716.1 hypothetical protein [Calothrix sp. CSU_2_0]
MEEQILGIASDVLASIGLFTGSAELEAAGALASAIGGCFGMSSNNSELSQVPVDTTSDASIPAEAATGFENAEIPDSSIDQSDTSQMDFSQHVDHYVQPNYDYLGSGLV